MGKSQRCEEMPEMPGFGSEDRGVQPYVMQMWSALLLDMQWGL